MLSFNRPHYLVPSVRSFISYMTAVEPDIPWTLQILDNGSGPGPLANITSELAPLRFLGHIRLVHLEQGVGLSRGFNLLFFDMCAVTGAPYVLSLEDDWQARSSSWPAAVPIMRAAMQLLQREERLLEVWLRDTHIGFRMHLNASWQQQQFQLAGDPDPRSSSSSTAAGRRSGPLEQQQQQQQEVTLQTLLATCDPASNPWGGYTNGASLKAFDRLQQLGRMPHVDGEADWSAKACADGWHVAYICRDPSSCYEPEKQWYTGLFEHIGKARVSAAQDARHKEATPAITAGDAVETLQDVPHWQVMPVVPVQRRGQRITIGINWQQQAGLTGRSWAGADRGSFSGVSRVGGVLLLACAVSGAIFAGVYYSRNRAMKVLGLCK